MDFESPPGDQGEHQTSSQSDGAGAVGGHKRSNSGGLLSKLSFLRASAEENQTPADGPPSPEYMPGDDKTSPKKASRAMAAVVQQKTRRRKGSLRKAALLGRGAARDRRDVDTAPLATNDIGLGVGLGDAAKSSTSPESSSPFYGLGLGLFNPNSTTSPRERTTANVQTAHPFSILPPPLSSIASSLEAMVSSPRSPSPTLQYTSTTDEEDVLSIGKHPPLRPASDLPLSAGSTESYFANSLTRRRSQQSKPKSPLSLSGLTTAPPPLADADWDYSETEWWGWVVLIVTWVVFVTGMGSCLGVWSWAWDVGETPYAPPELEDDPTLPIVGYYPALIILTGVMAWVWVVVAWVGMKYFRHARISGD